MLPIALPVLLAVASPLRAQSDTSLPGRLEKHYNPRSAIEGLSAAEARSLNAIAEQAAAIVAEHPEVATPPEGICLRLSTHFQGGVVGPRALAEASLSFAERYDARGCSERTTSGLRVRLNDAARLLHEDGTIATDQRDAEGPIVVIPRIGSTRDGRDVLLLNGERAVLLTRAGRPLLVPVTKERYLRFRMAEMQRAAAETRRLPGNAAALRMLDDDLADLQAELEALSPDDLRSQACASNHPSQWLGECTGANGYFSMAPDHLSSALPKSAIQVILVTTPHVRHNMQAPAKAALRWRIFEQLDYGRLEALMH